MNVRVNLLAPYWVNTPMVQAQQAHIEAAGTKLSFASIDLVVDAMVRSATDESVNGKSWGFWPEGYADFQDDEAGGWGGDQLRAHLNIQRSRGDTVVGYS